jgi:hypothetical protein
MSAVEGDGGGLRSVAMGLLVEGASRAWSKRGMSLGCGV